MRLVFLGPPGAGKGTQAKLLAKARELPHLSTGDMFRNAISRETPVGLQAKEYMDAGRLVPDEVVDALVAERLCEDDVANGFILDGYPRNLGQAKVLAGRSESFGGIDGVLFLDVEDEVLVERIRGRSAEEQRADDTEEVARERLSVYREHTEPLVAYYREQGLLLAIDGAKPIDDVREAVSAAVRGIRR